jgi:hypothetical protein
MSWIEEATLSVWGCRRLRRLHVRVSCAVLASKGQKTMRKIRLAMFCVLLLSPQSALAEGGRPDGNKLLCSAWASGRRLLIHSIGVHRVNRPTPASVLRFLRDITGTVTMP